jgi:hypothetical protein
MDIPPVDDHQDVLVALCRADGEATSKFGRGPLIFVEGDGGAGEGNVEKQASVEGQQGEASGRWDSARGSDTLTQGVKVAVRGSE